jgi:hypothetical protein
MVLIRLTFFSRNRLDCVENSGITEILVASRNNNRRDGITSALLYDDIWFAQELEGSETAVTVTFERILRDWRHTNVSLVTMQPVSERRYPSAAMVAAGRSGNNDDLFRHYCDGAIFDPRLMRADRISDLVEAVIGRTAGATHAA